MIEALTKLTKNVAFLVATAATGISSLLFFIEEYRFVLGQYDVLIGVSLFFILLAVAVIAHLKTQAKICKTRDEITKLGDKVSHGLASVERVILRSDIERFFDAHAGYKTLRIHQSQRLHELEDARIKLGMSQSSRMEMLLRKPVESREH